MKKLLALLMCLMMMLTMMTACGEDAKKSDKELIIGDWEATYDMGKLLTEMFDKTLGEGIFEIDEFEIIVEMSFDEDGIYTMDVDEDSFEDAFDGVKDELKDGLSDYLEALLEENGVSMSLDDYMELQGTTMDELLEESFDMEDMIDGFKSKGQYKVDDGKLYTSDDPDDDVDEENYETYELSENKLEITGAEGEEAEESEEYTNTIYPLVFKRK